MRIEIIDSARKHGITDVEILCVIAYPEYVVQVAARAATTAHLYIGRFDENEPLIEVLGEVVDNGSRIVTFHAMFLTAATARLSGLDALINPASIARTQRR